MTLIRMILPVLLFADVAAAQISTPPSCQGAVTDRRSLKTPGGRITFHLKFHDPASTFDARTVVKVHRQRPDASCNDGAVLDYLIEELVKERNALGP